MSDENTQNQNRVAVLYRALPQETLTAAWLTEGVVVLGKKYLRPGQYGPGAVDEYGIQYARLVSGAGYPAVPVPVNFSNTAWGSTPIVLAGVSGVDVNAAQYLNNGGGVNAQAAQGASVTNYNNGTVIGGGVQMVVDPPCWAVNNFPAVGTRATITKAALAFGACHVCSSISASFFGVAAVAADVELQLRDGATGAGTILWRQQVNINGSLANNEKLINLTDLRIVGSANAAMTLEFSVIGAATVRQSVSMTGFDVV